MIVPVDPSVLEQNPGFSNLYKDLCTRKLNPDGSSKEAKKQRVHDDIRKKLTTVRTSSAKSQILRDTLVDLPSKAGDLPPELHDVIELVSAQLNGHITSPSDRETIKDDVEYFLSNIPPISLAISTHLTTLTIHLLRIASPTSASTPPISSLPTAAHALRESAERSLPSSLATSRIDIANQAAKVLTLHRTILETSIRILEQTMHGSVARATRARAELLSIKAQSVEAQARIHTATHPTPAPLLTSLHSYAEHISATRSALRNREAQAEKALELYERAGGKTLLDIASRYLWLRREIEKVEGEIGRLERGE